MSDAKREPGHVRSGEADEKNAPREKAEESLKEQGARGRAEKPRSSVVSEVVVNMTILLLAAVVLIALFVNYSYGMLTPEYAVRYAPHILIPYIILFALTVAVFGWRLISREIVSPLRELIKAANEVASGNLSYRVEVKKDNELGMLARSFNHMTEQLERNRWELLESMEQLKKLNENLKNTQRELLNSEKLASVGRLAAGVAHEIGNPLSAIGGYLDILARRQYLEPKDREMLARIKEEMERIDETIKELLDYSKPAERELAPVNLNEVVDSTLILLRMQKGFEKIKLEVSLRASRMVTGNRGSLKQLLMNLVLNALDAMPEGGELRVETNDADREGMAGVELVVADTGKGIREEDLEKIFDPFFTTKEPGEGTGLGLSICQRIVENMKGTIRVESEPGKGAAFRVWLPAAPADSSSTSKNTDSPGAGKEGREDGS